MAVPRRVQRSGSCEVPETGLDADRAMLECRLAKRMEVAAASERAVCSSAWLCSGVAPGVDYSACPSSLFGGWCRSATIPLGTSSTAAGGGPVCPQRAVGKRFPGQGEESRRSRDGCSNIGLSIGGGLWEVKSPDGLGPRSIGAGLRKAGKQFANTRLLPGEWRGTAAKAWVVINGRCLRLDDRGVWVAIPGRMSEHGMAGVLHVRKDGLATRFRHKRPGVPNAGSPGLRGRGYTTKKQPA